MIEDGVAAAGDPQGQHAPVTMAVVGAGYWGPNLVRNVLTCPSTQLRYVCDRDFARAEQVAGPYRGVRALATLDAALEDDEVEAIAVATPADTHLEIALRALEAGKHVLVEKPLASSYAEGLLLVEAAEKAGRVLMSDHTYCYTAAAMHVRELVAQGVLGDIQFVDSTRINLGLVRRDIDVVWDLAPHDLSILDFVLQDGCRPTAVAAHGADPIGVGRACVAYLALHLQGGAIAHLHVNWLSPTKVRTVMIGGSKRTLIWDDLNPIQRLSLFDRGVDLSEADDLGMEDRRRATISYRTGDMVAPALNEQEALQIMITEFATCIREGREPVTDGRAGLRVLEVLEAASRSLETRGSVIPLWGQA